MTAADDAGNIETFRHDLDDARRAQQRLKRLRQRMNSCRRGSPKYKVLKRRAARLRRKLDNCRRHLQRRWANHLVHLYDTVCVEKLAACNMTRSAAGTNEAPGANVKAKTGLNRALMGVAPAEQTAILLRAGERIGTRIELVKPAGTSQRCNACSYRHRKNRKSQAVFLCRKCGHTDNADANAAGTSGTTAPPQSGRGWTRPGGPETAAPKELMQTGRPGGRTRHVSPPRISGPGREAARKGALEAPPHPRP